MPSFRLRAVLIAVVIAAFGAAGCVQAQEDAGVSSERPSFQDTTDYNLIYVPTPPEVVDRMMELGGVSSQDTVYDLGSGDGRMVIRAARQYDAYGVGIEIDHERVVKSRKNAKKAGVTDQVEFREKDFFKADFSEATVLLLYLLPDKLDKLKSKLVDEVEPGTPIVTHDFQFDGWEPDSSARVAVSDPIWGQYKENYRWTEPDEPTTSE